MARYPKQHKDVTRRRIIDTAGRRFKRDGLDGSGIATLMSDAGLTNGAFYAHFTSKDDLVAAVVSDQLSTQAGAIHDLRAGRAGLEDFVRGYLTAEHRDDLAAGCPSAALLDEIARSRDPVKLAYTAGAAAILDEVTTRLTPSDPDSARRTALSLFALLVGTMQLARAIADRAESDAVLERGIQPPRSPCSPADFVTQPTPAPDAERSETRPCSTASLCTTLPPTASRSTPASAATDPRSCRCTVLRRPT